MDKQYKTKAQAVQTARKVRAAGRTARVLCHEQMYTIPGRGFDGYTRWFTVEVDPAWTSCARRGQA